MLSYLTNLFPSPPQFLFMATLMAPHVARIKINGSEHLADLFQILYFLASLIHNVSDGGPSPGCERVLERSTSFSRVLQGVGEEMMIWDGAIVLINNNRIHIPPLLEVAWGSIFEECLKTVHMICDGEKKSIQSSTSPITLIL